MKEPLPFVFERGNATAQVMLELNLGGWTAPGIVSPGNFVNMMDDLADQQEVVSDKDALLAVAAGQWDNVLTPWHRDTVTVLKLARVHFADGPFAAAWRSLHADGGGRNKIKGEGRAVESAWQASEPLWLPKAGLTLTFFQAYRTNSETRETAWDAADMVLKNERGLLEVKADTITDICVKWYAIATATWPEGTEQGNLIRTIPTTYNSNQPPGQLRFTSHFAPAPNQGKLNWAAARGERFNIYAKAPGALTFDKILDEVTQRSWMGEGLAAGVWTFKGEAINSFGTGPMSEEVTVPVAAAQAA